jgi:hypothetical protein
MINIFPEWACAGGKNITNEHAIQYERNAQGLKPARSARDSIDKGKWTW